MRCQQQGTGGRCFRKLELKYRLPFSNSTSLGKGGQRQVFKITKSHHLDVQQLLLILLACECCVAERGQHQAQLCKQPGQQLP